MILDYEHFRTETNVLYPQWWTQVVGTHFIISADGQGPNGYGRYCEVFAANSDYLQRFSVLPNTVTLFWQAHVMFLAPDTPIVNFYNVVSWQGYLQFDADFTLSYHYDSYIGPQVIKSTQTFALNTWYFIQLKVVFSTLATGSAEIRVESVQVAAASNVRTAAIGGGVTGWGPLGRGWRQANIVVYDTLGNTPTDWTPETTVYADVPDGAGSVTQWTPLAGANWQNVDEVPADNDVSYNAAAAVGLDDLYHYPSGVPVGSIVYAVGAEIDARKDAAGSDTLAALLKSGATTVEQGSFGLSLTYDRWRTWWDRNPNTTGPWSPATANATEIGVRRKV